MCFCVYFRPTGYFWKQTQHGLRSVWRQDTHYSFVACFKDICENIHAFIFAHFTDLFKLVLSCFVSNKKLQELSFRPGLKIRFRPFWFISPSLTVSVFIPQDVFAFCCSSAASPSWRQGRCCTTTLGNEFKIYEGVINWSLERLLNSK